VILKFDIEVRSCSRILKSGLEAGFWSWVLKFVFEVWVPHPRGFCEGGVFDFRPRSAVITRIDPQRQDLFLATVKSNTRNRLQQLQRMQHTPACLLWRFNSVAVAGNEIKTPPLKTINDGAPGYFGNSVGGGWSADGESSSENWGYAAFRARPPEIEPQNVITNIWVPPTNPKARGLKKKNHRASI
jgi:hypothetical protein